MSGEAAEKATIGRVQEALFHIRKGLAPFVEARMKKLHGPHWLRYASRAAGARVDDALDAYGLLKTMIDSWRDAFDEAFNRNDKHRARNFLSTCFEARNAVSHLTLALADDEALSYLNAMHQLLRLVKAPDSEVAAVKALYDAQRQSGLAPAPDATPEPAPRLDVMVESGSGKALRPWVEVALPHPDVIANRFKEAEFAADLHAVDSGQAAEAYATPMAFFGITFLTEGLKRVLASALQRLGGSGGDPVIGLQTAFGGGKTHTMLAIYHLARHLRDGGDPRDLPGVAELVPAGFGGGVRPGVAVFVGTAKGTDISLAGREGPAIHTLWGYIAWRLAGEKGLALVVQAEAARTNPGSELLVELFRLAGPSVILLDEVVAFARQLPDERFEALLSFVQSLTEAAKMAPGVLVVGSLPESNAEAGGDKGVQALRRLQAVFGRVHSSWLPASGNETYEIIRRRLFQPLDAEGERARDEVSKAFHDLYKKNPAEFPPEAKEARYLELLRLSYPIHPELFDRLSKDWASLPHFQRTRGVLRFMANVIGVMWSMRAPDPLIMPGRVPLSHDRVRASVLYPLNPAFGAVLDREVDGDGSLPSRMEANTTRRMAQVRAPSRAARSVFLCTAPTSGNPNAGLTGQGLRLACAEPGDQLAIFGEALRELSERAAYLYEEGGRYRFSTQPTLNHEADNRAKALLELPHEIDGDILKTLTEDARTRGGFDRVFAAPDDPSGIDEARALSLLLLGPGFAHAGRGTATSKATEAVRDALTRSRSSQRRYRNTLVFVAPDDTALANAREVTAKAMGWASIIGDQRLREQTTQGQWADAEEKAKQHKEAARRAVRAAWSHIFLPIKSDAPGVAFDLEHCLISSRERAAIPQMVYDKIKGDGLVAEKLGGDRLWHALKPIWPEDRPHLPVSEVTDWFASYVYLPKLRDRVVLEGAIRDSVGKLDPQFGFADGFDEGTGKYRNLVWGRTPPEMFAESAVIVRKDAALAQLDDTPSTPTPVQPEQPNPAQPTVGGGTGPASSSPTKPAAPRRFYGSVEVDTARPVKAFDAIVSAVVMELQRTPGAKIKLTLEIEAEVPDGFPEAEVSIIRDNAKQLKFRADSTGFEE